LPRTISYLGIDLVSPGFTPIAHNAVIATAQRFYSYLTSIQRLPALAGKAIDSQPSQDRQQISTLADKAGSRTRKREHPEAHPQALRNQPKYNSILHISQ